MQKYKFFSWTWSHFPSTLLPGNAPWKLLGCSSGRKAQLVRRGGVCTENRHFIHHHVDQLFLTLKPPMCSQNNTMIEDTFTREDRFVHGEIQKQNTCLIIIIIIVIIINVIIIILLLLLLLVKARTTILPPCVCENDWTDFTWESHNYTPPQKLHVCVSWNNNTWDKLGPLCHNYGHDWVRQQASVCVCVCV